MSHWTAESHALEFVRKLARPGDEVLDVGGEGGEYKRLIEEVLQCQYHPLNTGAGSLYDITERPYDWPIPSDRYPMVISSSTFEHIEFPWLTFLEMVRVTARGGYIYINAPSTGPAHWDKDCWRFLKDSMEAFGKWGNVQCLSASVDSGKDADEIWHDCIGVFRKPLNHKPAYNAARNVQLP